MENTILDRIMARKFDEVMSMRREATEAQWLTRAREAEPTRRFAAAIADKVEDAGTAIIAEVKRASPSKGVICTGPFDPAAIARGYTENGAACLSCLTDKDFFQGDVAYLKEMRAASPLPIIQKDFIFSTYQIAQARSNGADCILLIMAVLSVPQAQELEQAALELDMDVLVEIHDENELEQAFDLRTRLLGINNRNLKTFAIDLNTTVRLAPSASQGAMVISESGIYSHKDIARLKGHGVHAFLIGESLMRESDPGKALGKLLDR